ncbi:hypothetical protein D3C86_1282380 [compost metagenome]
MIQCILQKRGMGARVLSEERIPDDNGFLTLNRLDRFRLPAEHKPVVAAKLRERAEPLFLQSLPDRSQNILIIGVADIRQLLRGAIAHFVAGWQRQERHRPRQVFVLPANRFRSARDKQHLIPSSRDPANLLEDARMIDNCTAAKLDHI